MKYRLIHGRIVLGYELGLTDLTRIMDIRHVHDGQDTRICYHVWDMGMRILIVVTGNWD